MKIRKTNITIDILYMIANRELELVIKNANIVNSLKKHVLQLMEDVALCSLLQMNKTIACNIL